MMKTSLFAVSKAVMLLCAASACALPQTVRAQNVAPQNASDSALPGFDFTKPQNLEAQNPQAFKTRNSIASMRQTPEGLEVVSSGNDPFFTLPPLDLLPGEPLLLRVRARSENGGFFQIYFYPEGEGPSEGRSVRLNVTTPGKWEDLRVPMPALGPRTHFRFDLPDGAGRTTISTFAFETQTQALSAIGNAPQPRGQVLANAFHRIVVGSDGAILSWQVRLDAKKPFGRNMIQRLAWDRTASLPPAAFPQDAWRWSATPTSLTATDDIGNRLRIELRGPQMVFALRPVAREYSPTAKPNAALSNLREGARLKLSVPFFSEASGAITSFASSEEVFSLEKLKRDAQVVEMDAASPLRIATRSGLEIVAEGFAPNAPLRFSPGFFTLSAQQEMPPQREHVFSSRVQAASTR